MVAWGKTKMSDPLVSVLIPLYNAENYLSECLDSVVNQIYKNLEVIIVNDGSTDNSLPIANEYADRYEWIKVYSQKNSGAASARNKAFLHSTGNYIQYLDADDILHPDKILTQIQRLGAFDYDPDIVATSKWTRFSSDIKNAVFPELVVYRDYENTLKFLCESWENAQNMVIHTWLISRKIHENVAWNENMIALDDNLFFANIVLGATSIAFVPDSLVYWRQDNLDSLSKKTTKKSMESYLYGCNSYGDIVKKYPDFFCLKHALAVQYSIFIYKAYSLYPDLVQKAEDKLKMLGFDSPLPLPTKKFQLFVKLIGFYPTVSLFGVKDRLTKEIRTIKGSNRWI